MNEDSFIAADPVFAVADGMGGHEAGEIASGICVRTLAEIPQLATGERDATAAVVQQYLLQADAGIREATGSRAGTTLSGVVVVEQMGMPVLAGAQHRRLPHLPAQPGQAQPGQRGPLRGPGTGGRRARSPRPQAAVHPRRHVVTRALGTGDETEADYWLLPVEEGDRILVCSDGLNGELDDEHISDILGSEPTRRLPWTN